MRGILSSLSAFGGGSTREQEADFDEAEDTMPVEPPPSPVGQDERRMQVRAYNHWAGMLGERNFPDIKDLDPRDLPDFGPYSVLLDFTKGIDNPVVPFLGDRLAVECGADLFINRLGDVPSRSLLSRITDHYMQILANQAPIGFEAEFINSRGLTVLYRGILLPFSSDDQTIDHIYGIINWKELADQATTDALLQELDGALSETVVERPEEDADSNVLDLGLIGAVADEEPVLLDEQDEELEFRTETLFTQPEFEDEDLSVEDYEEGEAEEEDERMPSLITMPVDRRERRKAQAPLDLAALADSIQPVTAADGRLPLFDPYAEDLDNHKEPAPAPLPTVSTSVRLPVPGQADSPKAMLERIAVAMEADEEATGLHDCLASARELADAARNSEDRTRGALYRAVSRAYDVSLAAAQAPEDFAELLADNGLEMQDRAPMTPVAKLVFGADYDKTRLAEIATVLSHAHRHRVARGGLRSLLQQADGGMKAVVREERRLRRADKGLPATPVHTLREELARRLRAAEPVALANFAADGPEFGVAVVRRLPTGEVVLLGEVPEDAQLVSRAGRRLLG